ncbi:MAG: ankyrin repeat domain-containing protein [Salinivirgaceae bacterium]|nr:ankyrin repeat domain-containing protein [Salinivirgaceae bacterium]
MKTQKLSILSTIVIASIMFCFNLNVLSQSVENSVVENQDLFGAINEGNFDQVKQCIEKDPQIIEQRNQRGSTPLMLAANLGNAELLTYFIKKGASVNVDNGFGTTALHFASLSGNLESVKFLIKNGAKVNVKSQQGNSPIHYAARSGSFEIVKLLVDQGADIMVIGGNESNLILWAAMGGNIEMYKYLESKNLDTKAVDKDGDGVLHWAGSGQSVEMCDFLVKERGLDIKWKNYSGKYPVEVAIAFGQLETAKYFFNKGIPYNQKNSSGGSYLHTAAQRGRVNIAEFLIEKGLDINAMDEDGSTPLNEAALSGNAELVKLLVEKGAKVNPKDCFGGNCNKVEGSPLHNAVWHTPDVIQYLVKNGAKLNAVNENGQTPLHVAAGSRCTDCFKELVELGSDLSAKDNKGKTPLHIAIKREKMDIVEYILTKNIDLNTKDNTGKTPLHYTAIAGYHDLVKTMVNKNANVNEKDNEGKTPLFYGLYYGNENFVQQLMVSGASREVFKNEDYLAKDLNEGEAVVWYLNHSGWAVKTAKNILIFDYWQHTKTSDKPCINNGYICSEQLKDEKVTVFVSHTHRDHYDKEIFEWKKNINDITYILGFDDDVNTPYTFISPKETQKVNGIKITPIESTDSGEGFMVEVDGVVIYHPGDHANGNREDATDHNEEIDFLAKKYDKVDLAFFPSTGCRFPDKEALKQGVVYAINKLKPAVVFPMHGTTNEDVAYPAFAKKLEAETIGTKFISVKNKGDRYFYSKQKSSMR